MTWPRLPRRFAASLLVILGVGAVVAEKPDQNGAALEAPGRLLPLVRDAHYTVNARIRPLWVFWMGRDDIGGAHLTWRGDKASRQAIEFVIGSDPARTPRQINQWGFVSEVHGPETAEVVGVMKDSAGETYEEAKARAEQHQRDDPFKAVHTMVTGGHATTRTFAFSVPADLTYRQVDRVLALVPSEPRERRAFDVPAGTKAGFFAAMTELLGESREPCRQGSPKKVPARPYLYNETIFDLSLTACRLVRELRTKAGSFPDVIDGEFQLKNRRTSEVTRFDIAYGTAGEWLDLPVRAVFRPRWWMEIELIFTRPAS